MKLFPLLVALALFSSINTAHSEIPVPLAPEQRVKLEAEQCKHMEQFASCAIGYAHQAGIMLGKATACGLRKHDPDDFTLPFVMVGFLAHSQEDLRLASAAYTEGGKVGAYDQITNPQPCASLLAAFEGLRAHHPHP